MSGGTRLRDGTVAIAEELARRGVRDVFTFMSKDTCRLVSELAARGVRTHHARHEHIAVGMADGYFRATGRLGIAIVGQSVGLTNCLNGLVTATRAHSHVLVLCGESFGAKRPEARAQRKWLDQRGLLDVLGVRHLALDDLSSAPADFARCLAVAEGGDDTLVVNLPEEILEGAAGDAPARLDASAPQRRALANQDRDTLVELLRDGFAARRVVILAGRGAVNAGARADLERLGDATGALLGTTLGAKGFFAGSPYAIGVVGSYATPLASELVTAADLILAFGASLNDDTTYGGTIFGKARVVQIDHREGAFGRYRAVDLAIAADAGLAAAALAGALEAAVHHAEGYRGGDTAARLRAFRLADGISGGDGPDGMDQRALMATLDEILPAERTVVVDGGSHAQFPNLYLGVPADRGHQWTLDYGAIGCGLGNALGAAVGRPERTTVLCIGDGGLMMTLGDLATAARYALRLVVVVSNNAGLQSEVNYLVDHGYDGAEARSENPPLELVARGLGLDAVTVTDLAGVRALAGRLRRVERPLLIDCRVSGRPFANHVENFTRDRMRTLERNR